MESIAAMHDIEKFKKITARLEDADSDERRWAIYDLKEFNPGETVPFLVKAIQDENRAVREAASEMLENVPSDISTKLLTPLLGSKRIEVRNVVAAVLVKYGDAAVKDLLQAIFDENEDVRKFGADILGLAGSTRAVQGLSKVSLIDLVENVRSSAVEALGKIGSPDALLVLYEILNSDDGPRAEAAEAIGHIGHSESKPILEDKLDTDDPLLTFTIVEALGKVGDRASLQLLYKKLEGSPGLLKNEICKSVLKIAQRERLLVVGEAFPALVALILDHLTDNNEGFTELVNFQLSLNPSVEILKLFYEHSAQLPAPLLVELISLSKAQPLLEQDLCSLVDHPDDWVAYTAVENLTGSSSEATRRAVLQVLENGSGMKVLAAIKNAVAFGMTEAVQNLEKLQNSENPDVKSASKRALRQLQD